MLRAFAAWTGAFLIVGAVLGGLALAAQDKYTLQVPNGLAFADPEEPIPKKSTEAPFSVNVPDKLKDVFLIEKDAARFPDTGGWGYALFDYNAPADIFASNGSGTDCGHTCHQAVAAKDYIFHPYQKR